MAGPPPARRLLLRLPTPHVGPPLRPLPIRVASQRSEPEAQAQKQLPSGCRVVLIELHVQVCTLRVPVVHCAHPAAG